MLAPVLRGWQRRQLAGEGEVDGGVDRIEDVCRVAAEFYHPDSQLVVRLGPDAANAQSEQSGE